MLRCLNCIGWGEINVQGKKCLECKGTGTKINRVIIESFKGTEDALKFARSIIDEYDPFIDFDKIPVDFGNVYMNVKKEDNSE